ncbi:MAG: trypsin-like peptidase domain-containing protein, partial [Spirochaetaceae bacterium]
MHLTSQRAGPIVGSLFTIILLLLLPPAVSAQKGSPTLPAAGDVRGRIDLRTNQPTQSYRLRVAEDIYAVELALSDATADLDLLIRRSDGSLFSVGETTDYNERLLLTRLSEPTLETGTYTVEVTYQLPEPPRLGNQIVVEIPYKLTVRSVSTRPEGRLIPGEPRSGTLSPEDGMRLTYSIKVPENAEALRLDVVESAGDIDLFVAQGSAYSNPFLSEHRSESFLSRESIVITRRSAPPLENGTYYVSVIDQLSRDRPVSFSLLATLDASPPALLLTLPTLEIPRDPLERALLSTVELVTGDDSGGSGVLVSPQGHILTNWHVIRGPAGVDSENIYVGLSLDHRKPSQELFRAELVDAAPERDLAFLRVSAGLHGQSLPPGYRFPSVPIGDHESLRVGESLGFVGFPLVGGTGSRVTITYTRGVVSGFEETSVGTIIKSDAEINEGNSGGAALNDEFELVG